MINIRGIGKKRHDASEYTKLEIYIPNKTDAITILIKREFYIVDNLSVKALISVNILKPKGIVIDFDKDLITIRLY